MIYIEDNEKEHYGSRGGKSWVKRHRIIEFRHKQFFYPYPWKWTTPKKFKNWVNKLYGIPFNKIVIRIECNDLPF